MQQGTPQANQHYLAIDPGETSGWATFNNEDGSSTGFGSVVGRQGIYDLLQVVSPQLLIMEDFNLFPWKSADQSWSQFETVRVLGACEYYAYTHRIKCVLQKPNIKSIAYRWAGLPQATLKRDSHERDAYVHGVYYLQSQGIRKAQQGGKVPTRKSL